MRRLFNGRSITSRITAGFFCAMALLFIAIGAFIYQRVDYALNTSISDVPSGNQAELEARRHHRKVELDELLGELAVAFAATLVISGFVGYRVARAALNPVERMRRDASAGSADLSFRLPVPEGGDELSRLAETLNDLLSQAHGAVTHERRLLADASHELRTPLAQAILQIDLALSRDRSPDELRAALVHLRRDTRRLVRLANDLLLIARADEGRVPIRPETIVVADAIDESRARLTQAYPGRDVVSDAPPELRLVADRDRFAQALDNLIENALAHGSGTVTVTARSSDRSVAVHVTDEGPGFPPGFTDHAFDRFATAAPGRSSHRTGLGLAIVAAIAAAHGGHATAANRPTGGADVSIELPSVVTGQRAADAAAPAGIA